MALRNGCASGRVSISRRSSSSSTPGLIRFVVIPALGAIFAVSWIATMAGAYSAGASLQGDGRLMPQDVFAWQSAVNPGRLGRATRQQNRVALRDRLALDAPETSASSAAAKSARLSFVAAVPEETMDERFTHVAARVALSRDMLAKAFGERRPVVSQAAPPLPPPASERFDAKPIVAALTLEPAGPNADRFGPTAAEGPSNIALALARSLALDSAEDLVGASARNPAPRGRAGAAAMASLADERGGPRPAARSPKIEAGRSGQPSRNDPGALAYADPNDSATSITGAFRSLFTAPSPKKGVAVYDISARTVYLPDGQKLEAHSGLGGMVDNPNFVHRKNSGSTPPNTYRLVMRESRFHGVEAIRLLPVDGKNKFGRDGLLAHTYMLRGGRAESNGCVVFRDYSRFLAAFKKGKVSHLIVVPGRSRAGGRIAANGRGV